MLNLTEREFLIFEAAGRRLAVSTHDVEEIFNLDGLLKIPGAPPHIVGLTNIRGDVAPIIDLGSVMFREARPQEASSNMPLLMVRQDKETYGLAIEEIMELIRVDGEYIVAVDEPMVREVIRIGDQELSVVHCGEVIQRAAEEVQMKVNQPTVQGDEEHGKEQDLPV